MQAAIVVILNLVLQEIMIAKVNIGIDFNHNRIGHFSPELNALIQIWLRFTKLVPSVFVTSRLAIMKVTKPGYFKKAGS